MQELLTFVDLQLKNDRSDVIHDDLAYLAEQMIELNKTKNDEIKGFLKWLERETGCEIDGLIGKTAIKNYHESDFEALLNVLKAAGSVKAAESSLYP